jgi:hypothetical protein
MSKRLSLDLVCLSFFRDKCIGFLIVHSNDNKTKATAQNCTVAFNFRFLTIK